MGRSIGVLPPCRAGGAADARYGPPAANSQPRWHRGGAHCVPPLLRKVAKDRLLGLSGRVKALRRDSWGLLGRPEGSPPLPPVPPSCAHGRCLGRLVQAESQPRRTESPEQGASGFRVYTHARGLATSAVLVMVGVARPLLGAQAEPLRPETRQFRVLGLEAHGGWRPARISAAQTRRCPG